VPLLFKVGDRNRRISAEQFRGGNAQFVRWNPPRVVGRHRSVVDVFEDVAP
jgi:hypothetical protein